MTEYLGAKPRRAAMIVTTLVVVLTLVVAGSLFQLLNLASYFESPYPSEETPLALTNTGVIWTMEQNLSIGGDCVYANIYCTWGIETERFSALLANTSEQQILNSGSPVSIENWHASIGYPDGDQWEIWTNLSDIAGDGNFSLGDSIAFIARPTPNRYVAEDEVMIVALVYVGSGMVAGLGEYSYAVHDGKFYSWRSESLDWSRPWYDPFLSD